MPDPILVPAWEGGRLRPVEKLEVHRRGLRHKAVSVFVQRGGLTLIQQRAASKYHSPLQWANACCTHPLWGESGVDCAQRRLAEELGIEGLEMRPRPGVEYRAPVGDGLVEHEVVEVFVAEAPPGLEPRPAPAEVAATEWIAPDALRARIEAAPERFAPWLRIYMAEHRAAILGA
ncbi:isopentenyl-diphosphate delta-isomerase [Jannaschia sp. W003]|uniref:isopentenyl-diphosphate Delta-isomerase n=1 Tax=Jannaschia sp. W003 TaxID=2867012 RepID=UPI0021A52713|nr:NUDIX domain-containing protein [Jannaschia sp. W003]UWQ21974.1 NUDIX domain-containing protein [Jannaschia sp. W003]